MVMLDKNVRENIHVSTQPPVVALMTDFGTKDIYVGAMKGVILGIAPRCVIADLTHDIAPQNIAGACWQLASAYAFFPASTLFCCVVDPGVGSHRKAVAVRTENYIFVAPDNGLLTLVLRASPAVECVQLDNPAMRLPVVSSTFHGRDVFAPAVAHLAAGVPLRELGSPVAVSDLVELSDIDPVCTQEGWRGVVIGEDHFGNVMTNIAASHLEDVEQILAGDLVVHRLSRTFADSAEGEIVAYIGSAGYLEIGVNKGNAAQAWKLKPGAVVRVIVGR